MSSVYDEGWAELRREEADLYLGAPGWEDPPDDELEEGWGMTRPTPSDQPIAASQSSGSELTADSAESLPSRAPGPEGSAALPSVREHELEVRLEAMHIKYDRLRNAPLRCRLGWHRWIEHVLGPFCERCGIR